MNAAAERPIGIFDSGVGGLTVASSIHQFLPEESIVYFGDTAHLPYGEKSHDAIRYYSLKICHFLLANNCKAIVVACNSASTAAYEVLLEFFKEKTILVNVVDPLVETCCQQNFERVGLIATHATVQSGVYEKMLQKINPKIHLTSLATPLLVPMIEEGFLHDQISHSVIENYLSDPSLQHIQALLLACTHYPLIKQEIEEFYSGKVKVFDSTGATAKALRNVLAENDLLNKKKVLSDHFYVSDYSESFIKATDRFYPEKIKLELRNIWL